MNMNLTTSAPLTVICAASSATVMVSPILTSRTMGPVGLWNPCWLRFFSLDLPPRPPRRKESLSSSVLRGATRGAGAFSFSLREGRCCACLRSRRSSSSRARSGRRTSSFLRSAVAPGAGAAAPATAATGATAAAGAAAPAAGCASAGAAWATASFARVSASRRAASSARWRASSSAFRRAASSAARCSSSSRWRSASISSGLRLTYVFFLRTSTLMVLLPATLSVVVVLRCKVILRGSSTRSPWLPLR
ncbi:hypothetical protein D9M71_551190 [compost metagenome]